MNEASDTAVFSINAMPSSFVTNGNFTDNFSHKRRRIDEMDSGDYPESSCSNCQMGRGKSFLPLNKSKSVFHTEELKPRGTTLYLPLVESLLINLQNIEQISLSQGSFFIADEAGNYHSTVQGNALHMWRFDNEQKRLYVSRSFLFTSPQEFNVFQSYLQNR